MNGCMTLRLFYDVEMGGLAYGGFISGEKNGFLPACHLMIVPNTCCFARYSRQNQLRDGREPDVLFNIASQACFRGKSPIRHSSVALKNLA